MTDHAAQAARAQHIETLKLLWLDAQEAVGWSAEYRARVNAALAVLEQAGASALPRINPTPIEEIRSALGLVASERNRWQGHDQKTFSHWERVYTILASFLLAAEVHADLEAAGAQTAQPSATVDEAKQALIDETGAARWEVWLPLLDALIAAVRQEPPPQTWQPIASAPKDGTEVLVCRNGRSIQQGAWNQGDSMCMPHWMTPGQLFDPTHWMPLPAPPAPEEGR